MGFNRGNSYGGGRGGNGGGGFEPKPGSGTLFFKEQKRTQTGPDYDGYFIVEFDVRAGEKIKLVGWDKQGPKGGMINLKMGRERQDAPGYNQGGQQGGYQGGNGGGYNNGGQQRGGYNQGPQQGYQGGGYQPMQGAPGNGYRPQQGYQPPPQNQPGSYQGGGYGGQPAQTYPHQQPFRDEAAGQPPAGATPAPMQPTYPAPPPEDDLPF